MILNCKIEDCNENLKERGYCEKHYYDYIYSRKVNLKRRMYVQEYLGNKCNNESCDITDPDVLTIDHINNDGYNDKHGTALYCVIKKEIREKKHIKNKYQLLCSNCNLKKLYII